MPLSKTRGTIRFPEPSDEDQSGEARLRQVVDTSVAGRRLIPGPQADDAPVGKIGAGDQQGQRDR